MNEWRDTVQYEMPETARPLEFILHDGTPDEGDYDFRPELGAGEALGAMFSSKRVRFWRYIDSIGEIHPPESMFLRNVVGKGNKGENHYEMDTDTGTGCPIVRSKQTGKWFTLSWTKIVNMAREAGIDEE